MNRRRLRWAVPVLLGIGLAVVSLRPRSTSVPPPDAPAPRARVVSPPPPTLPPTAAPGEPITVRVVLPAVPTDLSPAACRGWDMRAWTRVPVDPEGQFARLAVQVADVGEVRVPPRWARLGLDAMGFAPGDWDGLAGFSPWFGYAMLRIDHIWAQHDRSDRVKDIAAAHGMTEKELYALPASEREGLLDPLRPELAARRAETRALAEVLAGADEPAVRSVAIAMSPLLGGPSVRNAPDHLLDPALDDMARLALIDRCNTSLGPTERDTLRTRIRATDNGAWAVAGALVGLRSAWSDGDPAEISAWSEELDAARNHCLTWGPHGPFAHDPRLTFDGVPLASRPEGFPAAARDFAQRTGMTLVESRCDAPPCVARFERHGPGDPYGAADQIWGPLGHGLYGNLSGGVGAVVLVALDPEAGFTRKERFQVALTHGEPRRGCLDDGVWSTLRAELAAFVGSPQDWAGALRAAVFACHRDPAVGPADTRTVAGRWDGSWSFDPPEPFQDCVADRVGPPAPPAGTEITLERSVQ